MGVYTDWNNKKVDSLIQKHMDELTKMIFIRFEKENIYSILLIGGFARGEGTVKFIKKKPVPLNDYDLFIVTYEPIDEKILNEISLEFNRKMKIDSSFSFSESSPLMNFYSDLRNVTVSNLSNVMPFIKYFEIKHSAKVLYGEDARKLIPDFSLKDIPLQDGLRFLFNRASLLIECFRYEYLERILSPLEKQSLVFYSSKMYLTIAEALLLLSGRFVSSYKERGSIFAKYYTEDFGELHKTIPDLDSKILKYTKFKLKPRRKDIEISDKQAIEAWCEARDDVCQVIKFYLNRAFGLKFSGGWDQFASDFPKRFQYVFLKPYVEMGMRKKLKISVKSELLLRVLVYGLGYYLNFKYFMEMSKVDKYYFSLFRCRFDPWMKLFCVVPLLLNSIAESRDVDDWQLDLSIDSLKCIYPSPKGVKEMGRKEKLSSSFSYHADAFRLLQFIKV